MKLYISTNCFYVLNRNLSNIFPCFSEVIQKNLEPLRENIEKKKRAQDAYYENHSDSVGMSPLTRDAYRRPVKQRLGRSNMYHYTGTSTSFLPPKMRLRKLNTTLNNKINIRKTRNNMANQRLYRIRAKNHEAVTHQTGTKIRLRRTVPVIGGEPKNFQVEVANTPAITPRHNFRYQRFRKFRQILNVDIQIQIKKLQAQFTGTNVAPSRVTPAFTMKSLHDRFALLE